MLHSLLVKDYMTADHLAFAPEMDVLDAIHLLLQHELTGAPVVDHLGKVIGFLSEKDCIRVALNASYHEERGGPVSAFMSKGTDTLDAEGTLTEAAELFVANPSLLSRRHGRPAGGPALPPRRPEAREALW